MTSTTMQLVGIFVTIPRGSLLDCMRASKMCNWFQWVTVLLPTASPLQPSRASGKSSSLCNVFNFLTFSFFLDSSIQVIRSRVTVWWRKGATATCSYTSRRWRTVWLILRAPTFTRPCQRRSMWEDVWMLASPYWLTLVRGMESCLSWQLQQTRTVSKQLAWHLTTCKSARPISTGSHSCMTHSNACTRSTLKPSSTKASSTAESMAKSWND